MARNENVITDTELVPVGNICDIEPVDLRSRNIRLLGVDIENVLCSAGDPQIFPWASAAIKSLKPHVDLVLTTHAKDRGFIREVADGLGLRYLSSYGSKTNANKMNGRLFKQAANIFDVRPDEMATIDDQFKNYYFGACEAGLRAYFWAKPAGKIQHKGVRAAHIAESLLIRPFVRSKQIARDIRTDV